MMPPALFSAAALTLYWPCIRQFNNWGGFDWDFWALIDAVQRKTILHFHQFPLWNPYAKGGLPALGHPLSSFLHPTFLLTLIFGETRAPTVEAVSLCIIGMWGFYLLARRMGLSTLGSIYPPLVYFLSNFIPYCFIFGSYNFIQMYWIPWVFYFFFRSLDSRRHIVPAGLLLAFLITSDGLYTALHCFMFLAPYSLLTAISTKKVKPVVLFLVLGGISGAVAAIKLLPMYEFMYVAGFSREVPLDINRYYDSVSKLFQCLLDRDCLVHVGDWQYFCLYTGWIPILLAFTGAVVCFRRLWKFLVIGLFLLILAFGSTPALSTPESWPFKPLNLFALLHGLPLLKSIKDPVRYFHLVLFAAALSSGFLVSKCQDIIKNLGSGPAKAIGYILLVLPLTYSAIDIMTVSRSGLWRALQNDPKSEMIEAPFRQESVERDAILPFYRNAGNLASFDQFFVGCEDRIAARAFTDPGYRGEAYLVSGDGTAEIAFFSPNRIEVEIDTAREDRLCLNQNYFSGWKVTGIGQGEVESYEGLISTEVSPGKSRIIFYYLPASVLIGAAVSVVSLLACIFCFFRRKQPELDRPSLS